MHTGCGSVRSGKDSGSQTVTYRRARRATSIIHGDMLEMERTVDQALDDHFRQMTAERR